MPFSHKIAKCQLRVLKYLARCIIKKVEHPSRISYSENGSVYIHSYFKVIRPRISAKITTRISCHILQSKIPPDLDITFIQDCPDDEFVNDCALQINNLIFERIKDGEQKVEM